MSYQHFSTNERGRIEELKSLGFSHRAIGKRLGRHHSSIDREISRNVTSGKYSGEQAQAFYEKRRRNSVRQSGCTAELAQIITDKLAATWSPEQLANTVTKGLASFKSIYRWLYIGHLPNASIQNLRQKGKRQKNEKRGKFAMGVSISERPKEVDSRETFGHWELDTMLSSRGARKGCFATFVERKSRLYTALKIPDRTALSMENAITQLSNLIPHGAFQTGTTDRGKEFACFENIAHNLGIPLFFADPYSPWQRGSNENSNGLLRELYPKKTNLDTVNQLELTNNLLLINSRPRKCLGWKSPIQVFLLELAHLT